MDVPNIPPIMIVVKTVEDDTVTVDLNHPLAGQRLYFDVNIVEIREPSAQEVSTEAVEAVAAVLKVQTTAVLAVAVVKSEVN